MNLIERYPSLHDFILAFQQPGRFTAYNLWNLENATAKRTIEFRQHAGTLDFPTVVRWVVLCCYLIELACLVEPESLRELVLKHSQQENFSILGLLRVLGQGTVADMFEDHIYEYTISDAEDELTRAEIDDI